MIGIHGPGQNVILIGMMGSGKTTVGRSLAQRLGMTFVDTDDLIQRKARRSIPDIFHRHGEARFRALERRVIAQVARRKGQVIATGGGAILDPTNRSRLQQAGVTIWLRVTPEVAAARIGAGDDRPLLADPSRSRVDLLTDVLAAREDTYRQALVHVDTSRESLEGVVATLEATLRPSPESVTVQAVGGHYDVRVGWHTLSEIGGWLSHLVKPCNVAVISNPVVARLYRKTVTESLRANGYRPFVVSVPDGERYKTLRTASRVYDELVRRRFERGDIVVALGGGVVGDLAGFVAATYLRGVRVVQVPTTVVAQVDSSIGGKTGVDHPKGKNLIGAFHHPTLVWTDVSTLTTLPRREFVAGLAEVVKYGVISDPDLWTFLENRVDAVLAGVPSVLTEIVRRSAAAKARIVEQDEREAGLRRVLNYGHTAGHVVETLTGYAAIRHGEGVAIGMQFAAILSTRLGLCDAEFVRRQQALLEALGLPYTLPTLSPRRALETMALDKKVQGGRIHFVLPRTIGRATVEPVSTADILAAWKQASTPGSTRRSTRVMRKNRGTA